MHKLFYMSKDSSDLPIKVVSIHILSCALMTKSYTFRLQIKNGEGGLNQQKRFCPKFHCLFCLSMQNEWREGVTQTKKPIVNYNILP